MTVKTVKKLKGTQLNPLQRTTTELTIKQQIIRGQSNMTTGCIAATHGQFSGIRQVAPVCTGTLYMLPWATLSPNPKLHLDWFSSFCTAHSTAFLYFTKGRPFPDQNCPFPWGIWIPHLKHGSLSHPSSQPKWHLNRFSCFCRAHYCDRQTDRWTTLLGL